MRPLFEIEQDLQNIFEGAQIDEEGEYLIDYKALEALQMERRQKLVGVAIGVKNLTAEEDMIDKEIKALQARKKNVVRRKEGLKGWLKDSLKGEPLSDPKVKVTFRKAPDSAEVTDMFILPSVFIRVKTEPDKVAIKEALQDGVDVPGAKLVTGKMSMVIK